MGVDKEKEKQDGEKVEKLETFFSPAHEFLSDFENLDVTNFLCKLRPDSVSSTYFPLSF